MQRKIDGEEKKLLKGPNKKNDVSEKHQTAIIRLSMAEERDPSRTFGIQWWPIVSCSETRPVAKPENVLYKQGMPSLMTKCNENLNFRQ